VGGRHEGRKGEEIKDRFYQGNGAQGERLDGELENLEPLV
jgi:hypothetical protein